IKVVVLLARKENTKEKKGLIDYRIFLPALIIIVAISIPFSLNESASLEIMNEIFNKIVASFKWGYIWYTIILVGAGLFFFFFNFGIELLGIRIRNRNLSLLDLASIQ